MREAGKAGVIVDHVHPVGEDEGTIQLVLEMQSRRIAQPVHPVLLEFARSSSQAGSMSWLITVR